jgi:hypothetical protein
MADGIADSPELIFHYRLCLDGTGHGIFQNRTKSEKVASHLYIKTHIVNMILISAGQDCDADYNKK